MADLVILTTVALAMVATVVGIVAWGVRAVRHVDQGDDVPELEPLDQVAEAPAEAEAERRPGGRRRRWRLTVVTGLEALGWTASVACVGGAVALALTAGCG